MEVVPSMKTYLLDELQKSVLLCEEAERKRDLEKGKCQILLKGNGIWMSLFGRLEKTILNENNEETSPRI